jgi:molybdopterin-containing oxidoreductase family iron-sulfur binding subunit
VSALPVLDKADRIVSLDADFLGLDPIAEDAGARWAARRNPEKGMSRLYVVEPAFTVTGGVADHRLRIASSQVIKVAVLLAEALGLSAEVAPLAAKLGLARELVDPEWIKECAADLQSKKGKSLLIVGSRQPAEVHIIAGVINQALGAIQGAAGPLQLVKTGRQSLPGIEALAEAIRSGAVETLVATTPTDPAYDSPQSARWTETASKLKTLVHLGTRLNATGRGATWHVPSTHYLESWGDVRSVAGVISIIQPMILPLYPGCVSEIDLLLNLLPEGKPPAPAAVAGAPASAPEDPAYVAVRKTFASLVKGDVEVAWGLALRDGFVKGPKYGPISAGTPAGPLGLETVSMVDFPGPDSIEVVLTPSSHVWDGRFINNSWLQEVPDPVSKLTWDNAALMSLATAEALGVTHDGKMVSIKIGDAVVEAPAFRLPGQADFTIHLELGYGQQAAGRVGEGTGFNAYPLLAKEGALIVPGTKVTPTGKKWPLAPTAIHWSMEGRAIVRENTAEAYEAFVTKGEGEDWKNFSYNQGIDGHIPPNIL